MFINIKASDVAAIIGRNPYKTRDEVFNERINTYFGTKLQTKQTEFEDAIIKEDPHVQAYVQDVLEKSKTQTLETNKELIKIPDTVKEYVKHEIYKNNGTLCEEKTRNTFHVQTDKTCYTLPIYRNIRLIGYIDGRVEDGVIVEIKNRQKRLFGKVPEYERIQVQVYLKLTGARECKFIEQYKESTKEYTITFDEDVWKNIHQGVLSFAKELYDYQNGEDPIEDQY